VTPFNLYYNVTHVDSYSNVTEAYCVVLRLISTADSITFTFVTDVVFLRLLMRHRWYEHWL